MAQGIPVVVADRDIPRTLADVVLFDNERDGYEATRYLLSLRHRRIGGLSDLTPSADRARGYRRAQEEVGISVEEGWIVPGGFRYQGGELATLAAQWLISRIQGGGNDGPRQRTVLGTRLVVRDSCALR